MGWGLLIAAWLAASADAGRGEWATLEKPAAAAPDAGAPASKPEAALSEDEQIVRELELLEKLELLERLDQLDVGAAD